MLPEGIHSLAEIKDYSLAGDRVGFYAGLLEYVLKSITPDSEFTKFVGLVNHPGNFPVRKQLRLVHEAREVWNNLHHGNKRVTSAQVIHAEVSFREAIETILVRCPEAVQNDARGEEISNTPDVTNGIKPDQSQPLSKHAHAMPRAPVPAPREVPSKPATPSRLESDRRHQSAAPLFLSKLQQRSAILRVKSLTSILCLRNRTRMMSLESFLFLNLRTLQRLRWWSPPA